MALFAIFICNIRVVILRAAEDASLVFVEIVSFGGIALAITRVNGISLESTDIGRGKVEIEIGDIGTGF